MIRKKLLALPLALLLGLAVNAQNVDDVLGKYYNAMGGKEKLSKLKSVRMTASIEVAPGMKAPVTIVTKDNKAMRFDLTLQGMTMTQSFDGTEGWFVMPFQGKKTPEKMPEEMIKSAKDQADATGPMFNYKEKGNTVELLGKEDMEGTEVYKLKVTKKDGDVSYSYLDAATYLELKTTTKKKMQDKEVEGETVMSDYRSVDGIMFPFNVEERQVGAAQGQAIVIDKIEVNIPIEDSIFKMPKQ